MSFSAVGIGAGRWRRGRKWGDTPLKHRQEALGAIGGSESLLHTGRLIHKR